jgi:hypothetical protein
MLVRPTASVPVTPLNEALVEGMLAMPTTLIGKTFFFDAADVYYCIMAVEVLMNSCIF